MMYLLTLILAVLVLANVVVLLVNPSEKDWLQSERLRLEVGQAKLLGEIQAWEGQKHAEMVALAVYRNDDSSWLALTDAEKQDNEILIEMSRN
ncbi:MAG: hypothetical protein Q7K03_10605 [Dehalococcoidia bacterium]|nr:hypothetical protein [Dehalococcoidia bacterium]